jgi:hypothetical protein
MMLKGGNTTRETFIFFIKKIELPMIKNAAPETRPLSCVVPSQISVISPTFIGLPIPSAEDLRAKKIIK